MIGLDYVERTGPHLRVGLYTKDHTDLPPGDETEAALVEAAEQLAGLEAPWDIRIHGYRAELSYEVPR